MVADHYVCEGRRYLLAGEQDSWMIDVGYECRAIQPLDIVIENEF